MRISTDENDPGFCQILDSRYRTKYPTNGIFITVDGVEITQATMGDEEAGEALTAELDGEWLKTDDKGEIIMTTLRGKIVIHTPDGFPRDPRKWKAPLSARLRVGIQRWYRRLSYSNYVFGLWKR